MKVSLNSIEINVSESPVGIPIADEVIEGEDALDIVERMIAFTGAPISDVETYIEDTKQFLSDVHEIELPPIEGTRNRRKLCERFLDQLAEHGLLTIVEK